MANSRAMFRLLASLSVALALFFSPLVMSGDRGMAHAATIETPAMGGHCADSSESQKGQRQGPEALLDCTSICSAIADAQPDRLDVDVLLAAATEAVRPPFLGGIDPESETPPPRFS